MDKDQISKLADWLTIFGFLVSFLSLIISVVVLVNIKNIKNFYKLKVRGPELIKELTKFTSNLAGLLEDFRNNTTDIQLQLGQSEGKLRRLESMAAGQTKKTLKQIRKSVGSFKVTIENEQEVRSIYVEMMKALEEVKDHQKDASLER
jgi:hypothetical protein